MATGKSLPSYEARTEWLRGEGEASDVVMSSRVRLARNVAGAPFCSKATKAQRAATLEVCRKRVLACAAERKLGEQILWVDLHESPAIERTLLVERHLISKNLSKGRQRQGVSEASSEDPRAVAVGLPGERLSIMVNEEDHLRLQVLRTGLALDEAWKEVDRVDDLLEEGIDYAYSARFGYLTACPTNVGTGVRMSVMLHLPGLKLTGDIEKVRRAATDMNLAVRGFYGEGSDAAGDFYQISNQTTLGKPESVLLHELQHEIIPKVIEYERTARRALVAKRAAALEDQVWRAVGLLTNARLLATEESMQLLSQVRLGVVLGLVPGVNPGTVNHLMLLVQPAHLQRVLGQELDQEQRRIARATLVRSRLLSQN